MKLKNGYSDLKEEDIMKLSKEQMQQILLRLINYDTVYYDNYYTVHMLLPDDVADILRGRI